MHARRLSTRPTCTIRHAHTIRHTHAHTFPDTRILRHSPRAGGAPHATRDDDAGPPREQCQQPCLRAGRRETSGLRSPIEPKRYSGSFSSRALRLNGHNKGSMRTIGVTCLVHGLVAALTAPQTTAYVVFDSENSTLRCRETPFSKMSRDSYQTCEQACRPNPGCKSFAYKEPVPAAQFLSRDDHCPRRFAFSGGFSATVINATSVGARRQDRRNCKLYNTCTLVERVALMDEKFSGVWTKKHYW